MTKKEDGTSLDSNWENQMLLSQGTVATAYKLRLFTIKQTKGQNNACDYSITYCS